MEIEGTEPALSRRVKQVLAAHDVPATPGLVGDLMSVIFDARSDEYWRGHEDGWQAASEVYSLGPP